MHLLTELVDTSVDPEYSRATPRRRQPWLTVFTLLLAGLLIGVALLQNARSQPAVATERARLIAQIASQRQEFDALHQRLDDEHAQVDQLRSQALGRGSSEQARLDAAELNAAVSPVDGPGIVVTVDDATSRADDQRQDVRTTVLDVDLRQLANGLWAAGAEAISINGHRLTARSAIRSAGSAITVDYASLTRPYVVSAVGDAKRLPARFGASSGGAWWDGLKANYNVRYEVRVERSLHLPGSSTQLTRAGQPR